MNQESSSNIELLRIVAGLFVIILHFNFNPAGGGAVEHVIGINYYFLIMLELICACAVNVFILISGYFGCESNKLALGKLIGLLIQTIVFSFLIELLVNIIHRSINVNQLIISLLPVNYYVMLYVALMCMAPFINIIINKISIESLKHFVIILMCLNSIWPTIVDVMQEISGREFMGLSTISLFGSGNGYTIVNFILIYVVGAYIRKTEFMQDCSKKKLLILLAMQVIVLGIWKKVLPNTAWQYSNPIVILEAIFVFLLFKKISIYSKFINKIAPASFSCYLIHEKLLSYIDYSMLGSASLLKLVIFITLVLVVIYTVSIGCMLIWNKIINIFIPRWKDKIPVINVR